MNAKETTELIDGAGGDTAFGKLLGIDGDDGFQQRINNWKRRGMPSDVVLEHYELLQRLKTESASSGKSRRSVGSSSSPA